MITGTLPSNQAFITTRVYYYKGNKVLVCCIEGKQLI